MKKEGFPSLSRIEEINRIIDEIEKLQEAISADEKMSKKLGVQHKYPDPRLNELAELRIKLKKLEE